MVFLSESEVKVLDMTMAMSTAHTQWGRHTLRASFVPYPCYTPLSVVRVAAQGRPSRITVRSLFKSENRKTAADRVDKDFFRGMGTY